MVIIVLLSIFINITFNDCIEVSCLPNDEIVPFHENNDLKKAFNEGLKGPIPIEEEVSFFSSIYFYFLNFIKNLFGLSLERDLPENFVFNVSTNNALDVNLVNRCYNVKRVSWYFAKNFPDIESIRVMDVNSLDLYLSRLQLIFRYTPYDFYSETYGLSDSAKFIKRSLFCFYDNMYYKMFIKDYDFLKLRDALKSPGILEVWQSNNPLGYNIRHLLVSDFFLERVLVSKKDLNLILEKQMDLFFSESLKTVSERLKYKIEFINKYFIEVNNKIRFNVNFLYSGKNIYNTTGEGRFNYLNICRFCCALDKYSYENNLNIGTADIIKKGVYYNTATFR